jgi:hypothetical protein
LCVCVCVFIGLNASVCVCVRECSKIPFSVRSRLNESVLERPGSAMTLEPSLTVKSMDR